MKHGRNATETTGKGILRAASYATGASFLGRSLAAIGDMVLLQRPRWENGASNGRQPRLDENGNVIPEKQKRGLFAGRRSEVTIGGVTNPINVGGGGGGLASAFKKILDVRLVAGSQGIKEITDAQGMTTRAVDESSERITGSLSQSASLLQGEGGKFKAGNPGGKSKAVQEAKLNNDKLDEIADNQQQQITKEANHAKVMKEKISMVVENTNPVTSKASEDYQNTIFIAGNKLSEQGNEYLSKSVGLLNIIARLLGFEEREKSRRGKAILGAVAVAGAAKGIDYV